MQITTFQNTNDLTTALVDLLAHHLALARPAPHAVLLPGGRTPRRAYQQIAQNPCPVDGNTRILLSDERMVPMPSAPWGHGVSILIPIFMDGAGTPAPRLFYP